MEKMDSKYYVYVYIDPRNYDEFYYGKGKGGRKESHLKDVTDSEKTKRIKAIEKEGLNPIIKVIAKELTEKEAFLIEKTLIWKLGKSLLNKSTGHFADKFRPHDTLHLNLPYFDYENGLFFVNVGEGEFRCWEDSRKYGFLSAGQDKKYSDQIRSLKEGDFLAAYLNGRGYVGVGKVTKEAVRVNKYTFKNKHLSNYDLKVPNINANCDNEKTEYLVEVEWIKTVDADKAKWKKKSNLFWTQLIKASLDKQHTTKEYLEKEFDIEFDKLLRG